MTMQTGPRRRSTDDGEPSNAVLERILIDQNTKLDAVVAKADTISAKADEYVLAHAEAHAVLDRRVDRIESRVDASERWHTAKEPDINNAHDTKVQLDLLLRLIAVVGVGTLITGGAAIINLIITAGKPG